MAENEKTLGPFPISLATSRRLRELQDAVRKAGHHRPSQGLLVSALIHCSPDEGRKIELNVLAPYRIAHPDEHDGGP